ncbi:ATP-binding cassette domain-containing protein [Salidesulfovibrio brasiliensis]|uniref:ATP-binding cassette domain-containing protein n=1 Tax=Salidesulfovibrio brasiliensis TaxID=221711 RepID=UPI0006CFE514|nr:ATP-binding cassette domain-containing protein [Salidesulfovibrio brasiliensis]
MSLLNVKDVTLNFTGTTLLEGVSFLVEPGERVCLMGRNGEGKSTLLKVVSGDMAPDSGDIAFSQGAKVAMLPQDVPEGITGTVYEVACEGLGALGRHLIAYHNASHALETGTGDEQAAINAMETAQTAIEREGGWEAHRTVETVLSHLDLQADEPFSILSGGTQRRALLARALVCGPDLLILDEPTNHLDIEAIVWLEEFLTRRVKTMLFVTHDRAFLRSLSTRILELDRGRLSSFDCGYDTYLDRKEAELEAEEKQRHNFEKKLAQEEAWIRQGIKARRTRNMGRVRELRKLRQERSGWRNRPGKADMLVQEAGRTGKLVAETTNLCFAYEGKPIVSDLSTAIMRGDKVGLIGPNGAGKTTLLRLLLGQLEPQSGSVRHGTNIEILYYDQHRETLEMDKSARDNIASGADFISVGDKRVHVMGWLKRFLFTPDRANLPVHVLSGGERNRLLLARLFTRPSNVLVMDEPTNDLDAETLDLLEDILLDYSGTLLLVSHDREFLNNVVTSTLALEGQGVVREYVGGYDDWLRQRPQTKPTAPAACKQAPEAAQTAPESASKPEKKQKLSYKDKFRLERMAEEIKTVPARIETLEADIEACQERLGDPELYKGDGAEVVRLKERMETLESELETLFAQWESMESELSEHGMLE